MKSNETEPNESDRAQHLHAAFLRAVHAIERSISDASRPADLPPIAPTLQDYEDLRILRSTVRGAAAAYARRLRDEGVTPERMLVLVKATTDAAGPGFGARELTNDIVRWSIEAYFDE